MSGTEPEFSFISGMRIQYRIALQAIVLLLVSGLASPALAQAPPSRPLAPRTPPARGAAAAAPVATPAPPAPVVVSAWAEIAQLEPDQLQVQRYVKSILGGVGNKELSGP